MYVTGVCLLFKALGPGERWITVRPNGPGTEGHPILIQPQPDGSAKVIGGAGGALNHLRLTGVKPASSYKDTIAARAKERRDRATAQRERDKAAGIHQAKSEAHAKLTDQHREHHRAFVRGVAAAMGWGDDALRFDESKVADKPEHVVAAMRRTLDGGLGQVVHDRLQ